MLNSIISLYSFVLSLSSISLVFTLFSSPLLYFSFSYASQLTIKVFQTFYLLEVKLLLAIGRIWHVSKEVAKNNEKCAAFLNGGLNFQIKNSDFIKIILSVDSSNNDPFQQKVAVSGKQKFKLLYTRDGNGK